MSAPKPADLTPIPETHTVIVRTNSCKLCPDYHTYHRHMPLYMLTHVQKCNKNKNFLSVCPYVFFIHLINVVMIVMSLVRLDIMYMHVYVYVWQ